MRRVLLILATLGTLCLAASQVQADGHGHYYGGHGGHYAGYYGRSMVHPPVWVRPAMIVPAPIYPRAVYPPAYCYPRYNFGPTYGFYYQGRGLSLGVGF